MKINTMNKGERQRIEKLKYKKRVNQFLQGNQLYKNIINPKLYVFKSTGKPCSCFLCRNKKYKREKVVFFDESDLKILRELPNEFDETEWIW